MTWLSPPTPQLTGDVHQTWPGKRWYQKPGPWCRTKARLGRRGAMLLMMGTAYLFIGAGEPFREVATYPGAWHQYLPIWLRVSIWAVPGVLAVVAATRRRWRTDAVGWFSLFIAPFIRSVSYATSFAVWVVTGGRDGSWVAIFAAVIYGCFMGMSLICSGWSENPPKDRCNP